MVPRPDRSPPTPADPTHPSGTDLADRPPPLPHARLDQRLGLSTHHPVHVPDRPGLRPGVPARPLRPRAPGPAPHGVPSRRDLAHPALRGDRTMQLIPSDLWYEPEPFRAHVNALVADTGLHWRLLAARADIAPRVMSRLLHG